MPDRLISDGHLRGLFYAFMVVVLAAVALTMVAVLVIVQEMNERGKDSRKIIQAIAATQGTILDCTEEDGACYKRGQDAQAEAVTGIGDNTYRLLVAGLSCEADGIVDEEPLAKCMARRAQGVSPLPG